MLGTVNPLESIIRQAHDAGALVLVDGAQAVPHHRVDVRELDADFYGFTGHKVYGPDRRSASCTGGARCSRRCRRSWAAAT